MIVLSVYHRYNNEYLEQKPLSMISDQSDAVDMKLPHGSTRALRRRRISLLRATLVILITSAALVLFVFWYRSLPQGLDCARSAQRVASALEVYTTEHHRLPPILDVLPVKKGRFGIEHFDYWFAGIGGPAILPDGTIVAYCVTPHPSPFQEKWRSAIIFKNGHFVISRVTEND